MDFRCPICHLPVRSSSHPLFPFCSDRCRLTDLGNWASGRYAIPDTAAEDSTETSGHSDELEN